MHGIYIGDLIPVVNGKMMKKSEKNIAPQKHGGHREETIKRRRIRVHAAWLLLPATLGPGALIALQEACYTLAALLAMAAAVAATIGAATVRTVWR
jgi:hypothetical protein